MQTVSPVSGRTNAVPWYRHRWPWLLMLGPGLVVLAGVHTTWLAFTHQDALVSGDYYKEGKAINQDLRRMHAAAALQLEVKLRHDPAGGKLYGEIVSKGLPYAGPLIVALNHSTLPEKDIQLMVQADGKGRFESPLLMLDMAHWTVTIENAGRDWRMAERWMWPQQKSLQVVAADTPVLPE